MLTACEYIRIFKKKKEKRKENEPLSQKTSKLWTEEAHWVYVWDAVEGQIQPGELRRLGQKMGESLVEVAQVTDDVVIKTQGAT